MFICCSFSHFPSYYSAYCKGETKATNDLRELMLSLRKGSVPVSWRSQYAARPAVSLGEWVSDLAARTRALSTRYAAGLRGGGAELAKSSFWVGGMFTPEAFVTATRQQTAQVCSRCGDAL
jgi:dynein heavy chain 1